MEALAAVRPTSVRLLRRHCLTGLLPSKQGAPAWAGLIKVYLIHTGEYCAAVSCHEGATEVAVQLPQSTPPHTGAAATDIASASDEQFMGLALEQAALAFAAEEVPVGAVLVSPEGEVLAAAHNQTEGSSDPTAHAELLCIRQASTRLGGWRLLDATLYVTLEPCPMCAGAVLQARVGTVVYGARNTLLGADGSWISMLPRGGSTGDGVACSSSSSSSERQSSSPADASNHPQAAVPRKPHPFHPHMQVRRGVLAAECGDMMRRFFALRRKQAAASKAS